MSIKTLIILFGSCFIQIYAQYSIKEERYPSKIKTFKTDYHYNDSLYHEFTIYFNKKGQKIKEEYYLIGLNSYGSWIKNATGWKKYYYTPFDSIHCIVDYNRPIMYSMLVTEKDSLIFEYDSNNFNYKTINFSFRPAMGEKINVSTEYYFPPSDSFTVFASDQYGSLAYDTTFNRNLILGDTLIKQEIYKGRWDDRIKNNYWLNNTLIREIHFTKNAINGSYSVEKIAEYTYPPDSSCLKLTIDPKDQTQNFDFSIEEKYNSDDRIMYKNMYRSNEIKEERKNFTEYKYEFNYDGTLLSTTISERNSTGYTSLKTIRYYYTYY